MKDSIVHGFLCQADEDQDIDNCSIEALDLLLNFCSSKEVFQTVIKSQIGIDQKTLESLANSCDQWEFEDSEKQKTVVGKIKQVISDNFEEIKLAKDFSEPLIQI